MTQYGFGSIPQVLTSNGSGIIPSFQSLAQPIAQNLGIAQTSGTTFTVQGANGVALSASNPAYVTLQSLAHPGQLITYKIIANQSFSQAQLGNNLFGVTTAVNWSNDMPFYLYAVSNANNGENTITFMISRIPHRTIAPLATKIGQSGNTNATTQGSFFSLATITAADYASSPCLCIGSFRMRYASSLWTVQTLNNGDGIGEYNVATVFFVPFAQFGAAASTHWIANGGTAPVFTNDILAYEISLNGYIFYSYGATVNSTPGAGAVEAHLILPFITDSSSGNSNLGSLNSAGTLTFLCGNLVAGNNYTQFSFVNTGASGTSLTNANIGAATSIFTGGNYLIGVS